MNRGNASRRDATSLLGGGLAVEGTILRADNGHRLDELSAPEARAPRASEEKRRSGGVVGVVVEAVGEILALEGRSLSDSKTSPRVLGDHRFVVSSHKADAGESAARIYTHNMRWARLNFMELAKRNN